MNDENFEHMEEIPPQIFINEPVEQHLLQTRKILIHGPITESTAAYVTAQLQLFARSTEPVWLYICSPGGDMNAAYAIIDQMELSPFEINTVVRGMASSAGALIAIYGTPGCRYITNHSAMMLHSPRIFIADEPHDTHRVAMKFYDKFFDDKIKDITKRTSVDKETIMEYMSKTCWVNAKESVENGFVDQILTKKIEVASNFVENDEGE